MTTQSRELSLIYNMGTQNKSHRGLLAEFTWYHGMVGWLELSTQNICLYFISLHYDLMFL